MVASASGAGSGTPAELSRFRRLANLTVASTFLLIIVGGVVRVSDSGLGCGRAGSGTKGWPFCNGRAVPVVNAHSIVEYSHRILASLVVALIALMIWRAFRRLRSNRLLVRGSVAAGVLVVSQAVLGGLTVENNLDDALVAAHLCLAMLLLGTLITLAWAARPERIGKVSLEAPRGVRILAIAASALVLGTIVAGGYMAGTQEHGAQVAAGAPQSGAHLACGKQFPSCQGSFFPWGRSHLTDIHLTHRAFMYLAVLALLGLLGAAWRYGLRSRLFALLTGVLIAQVLLGAMNVWLGEHAELVVTHLAMGTLLWSTTVLTTLQMLRVPEPGEARAARESEAAKEPGWKPA
jgi:heme A synthase